MSGYNRTPTKAVALEHLTSRGLNHELANTSSVHYTTSEPMTEKMETLIAQAEKEIAAGELSGPFASLEEMFVHLDSL